MIPFRNKTMCSCIADAPGGFMQSLLKFSEENLDLKYIHGITLVSDNDLSTFLESKFIK